MLIFCVYRERIQKVAAERDGVVMVTWANFKYLDFAMNWLAHMQNIGVTTYMIGAMDTDLLKVTLLLCLRVLRTGYYK